MYKPICSPVATKKRDVYTNGPGNGRNDLSAAAVSKLDCAKPIFVEPGAKSNRQYAVMRCAVDAEVAASDLQAAALVTDTTTIMFGTFSDTANIVRSS